MYCAGRKTQLKTQCPTPWIVEIPLSIAIGEQAAQLNPVFASAMRRDAARKAVVLNLRALRQEVGEGAMRVARAAWAGRTFAELVAAARRL